ncbi:MAG TPA: TadE/TadG family type IV pilus assembly protein [Candidatus Limnocylindrales bacterium]|nr:TadE/TadG family type IV pilus assembly protein [Candidatus Limnocylindrales bacterium]
MARLRPTFARGQATVEFALSVIVFVTMLCGVFDLGRGVYENNALSEAARELARTTSVHPGSPLGTSSQTSQTLATQRGLVMGMGTPTYACVDIDGSAVSGTCRPGNWVKVTVQATYSPVTPLLGIVGPFTFTAASSVQIANDLEFP